MTRRQSFVVTVVCAALLIGAEGQRASSGGPSGTSSLGDAIDLVRARLITDKAYEPWGQNGRCLRFLGDGESETDFGVVVREQHSLDCGGDPATSPVVDRFRVRRNSNVILWLDYSGEYRAYEEVRRHRLLSYGTSPVLAPDPPQRFEYRPVPLEGQSAAQLDADDAACEELAQKATAGRIGPKDIDTGEVTRSGMPIIAGDNRGYDAYRNCMFERGYKAAHEPPPPTPIERPVTDRPAWCNGSFDIWDPESDTCRPKYPLKPGF